MNLVVLVVVVVVVVVVEKEAEDEKNNRPMIGVPRCGEEKTKADAFGRNDDDDDDAKNIIMAGRTKRTTGTAEKKCIEDKTKQYNTRNAFGWG